MAGEDSPLLQPEASAGPRRRVCKFAVLTALALGAVGAVASSRVQGRHVVEGPPAALFEDVAPPSDSSDVFGCGCTIGWCCKNKDLFDHAFATKQDDESSTFLGTTPCALFETVIGNAGWHFDPRLSKDTICAEVDAGKRDGSLSVCDQPEMLLHVDGVDGPSFNQESRTMFIIEFGKSCAEGPSVGDENLPGTDDLSVRPFGEMHGPAMQIMAFDTLQDWATVTGVDKATNKSGTVTVATCDWETQCVPGKGQTVKVIPGARPSEDFVPCVDWNISAFIGPYGQGKNAYGVCVDFEPEDATSAGGRVVFTSLSGSKNEMYIPGGINTKDFAKYNPNCVAPAVDVPDGTKKTETADSTIYDFGKY